MDIKPSGSVPSRRASSDWFSGTVWMDPIIEAEAPARLQAVTVRFEPGARTAWHTHPLGQTLHVTSGSGLAQVWGGPICEIKTGDTVWIPPGEKHWLALVPITSWCISPCRKRWMAKPSNGWKRSPIHNIPATINLLLWRQQCM